MNTHEFCNGSDIVFTYNLEYLNNLDKEECNNIAVGPQEEFFNKIDSINTEFAYYNITPIAVTDKWNWKPGTYDRVKEYIYKRLELHKKAKNTNYLVSRTRDRINYLTYINRQFDRMENERYRLKDMGVTKNIDIDKFKETCNLFVNNIQEQCKIVAKITDNKVIIKPQIYIKDRTCFYYVSILLNNLTMSLFEGEGTKPIQELPLGGMHIIARLNLRYLLINKGQQPLLKGTYLEEAKEFPYITNSRRQNSNLYGNVCTDKHADDVYNAFDKSNYKLLAITLMQWAQYYHIQHSNPYNKPHLLHFGLPNNFSTEYKATVSLDNTADSCRSRLSGFTKRLGANEFDYDDSIASTCNSIDCQIKQHCKTWSNIEKRKARTLTDYGYQTEGIVGVVIEHLINKYVNNIEEIAFKVEMLAGQCRNYDNIEYDEFIQQITVRLYYYYIRFNKWDSYIHEFLKNQGIFVQEEKEMSNEEILTLTQSWAQSSEGGR